MITPALHALGSGLSPLVRLGTSSWSFPGWRGLIYQQEYSERMLARHGLGAYGAHPLLRTVGVDRTFYAPVPASELAAYAAAVPPGFEFLVKAYEGLTLARYPNHARYGAMRGSSNPTLFDVSVARDQVVGPYIEGLGDKAGILLLQFAPQPAELFAPAGSTANKTAPRRFAERLYRFLRVLPKGPRYAVEVRTPALLTEDYAACLRAAGAIPSLAAMPGMPDIESQATLTGARDAKALVIRWLLAPHHDYEGARAAYRPFDAIVDPDPPVRSAIARLIKSAVGRSIPAFVIVNNKAEGSSPLSVQALAALLADANAP